MFVVLFVAAMTSSLIEISIGSERDLEVVEGMCSKEIRLCKCGASADPTVVRIKECGKSDEERSVCEVCSYVGPERFCSKPLNCVQCRKADPYDRCSSCPPLKYGRWCEFTCDCLNGASCGRNGTCICAEGFRGQKCEQRTYCFPRQPIVAPLQEIILDFSQYIIVAYKCPSNLELRGSVVTYCEMHRGLWSESPPRCLPKCPLLSAPANGILDYSQSDLVEGVFAITQCTQHHRLVGNSTVRCLAGGVWSLSLPTCEQMPICPDPGMATYSTRQVGPPDSSQVGPFFEGMTLHYICSNGFEQIGDNTIECLADGIWSNGPPMCVKVSRIVPSCQTKASDVLQENGIPVRLYCPPGCAQPQPNVWGTVTYTTNSSICPGAVHAGMVTNYGGAVEVISNGIYPFFIGSNLNKIKSASLEELSESFRFNKLPVPKKDDENCPKGLVKMGEVCIYISSNLKTREEANATCANLGLSMGLPELNDEEDERNLTALLRSKEISQVWTSKIFAINDKETNKNLSHEEETPEPKCGTVIFSNNQVTEDLVDCNTNASFTCFQDFNSITLATCHEPNSLSNGRATSMRTINGLYYVGSSIEYRCDPLHYMKGTPVISCTANGTWSGELPTCIQVDTCDDPPVPIDGSVEYVLPKRDTPSRRKASIQSVSVFRLSRIPIGLHGGVPEAELNSTKLEAEPEIEDIELPLGKHKIGTRAVYECVSRYYERVGSRTRRCEMGGRWSGRPPTCMPKCGHSDSPRTPFIVNGNATDVGQWPWQAAISRWIPNSEQWFLICGGSLLNERWVITAAHCVTYPAANILINKERFRIYLGKYHRKGSRDDYVQMRKVHEIHIHRDYDSFTFDSDIALIQLDSPVQLNSRTQPVCLPTERTTRENLVERNRGVVTGWGMTQIGTHSDILQQAVLPVVSARVCEEGYIKAEFPLTVTVNMFCAGYAEGKADSCSGDSGGPFVFLDPTTKEKRWVLEGIISWGSPNGCGKPFQYGGFTTVSKFLDWIQLFL